MLILYDCAPFPYGKNYRAVGTLSLYYEIWIPAQIMDNPVVIPLADGLEAAAPASAAPTPRSLFLGGIFLLILLCCIHAASEIVIPVVLAFVLKLVFQPIVRFLGKWKLPQTMIAGIIIIALLSSIGILGTMLSGPAASWAEKLPHGYPQLQERLNFLRTPVEKTQKILIQADDLTKGAGPKVMPVAVQGTRLSDKVFTGTQAIFGGLFTTMLVLFFLLASGDTFLRRLVEVLPRFKDKRQAVDISQAIEQDISSYLLTITAMNACVGVATAVMMRLYHIDDPILWGALAFLLNYIPIMGPIICMAIFALVGLLGNAEFLPALLPAASYYAIRLLEGSFITPMLLAKRFTLNPVLVILSLVFWYWMWGVAGAILAMPMLAIAKIICSRIERLAAFGHFLEG